MLKPEAARLLFHTFFLYMDEMFLVWRRFRERGTGYKVSPHLQKDNDVFFFPFCWLGVGIPPQVRRGGMSFG